MDKLVIKGGKPLEGAVRISGAKNAALPILAATLLAPGDHQIDNLPVLRDVKTFQRLLQILGAQVTDGTTMWVDTTELTDHVCPYEIVKTMRASVLALGPLVARLGRAWVSLPGGCAIGARPIDLHLKGLSALGADIRLEHGYVIATAEKLKGAKIVLDVPTVTGTENLMMAASLAEGVTTIENAAKEPEIVDLARALTEMGAQIRGAGTNVIAIEGVKELKPLRHKVMPDRIEAGTFLCAVGLVRGDVTLENGDATHLEALVDKLRGAGMQIDVLPDGRIHAVSQERLEAVDVKTHPYPGFATDLQAQFMATMSRARGTSVITENIFENRFQHVPELRRMGASIDISGPSAVIKGNGQLSGANVMATDLRASASLVLAGLSAEGETHVHRIYHLDRGYESLEKKFAALGADIRRTQTDVI